MAAPPLHESLLTLLMPKFCYEELFVKLHLEVACLGEAIRRSAGLLTFLDTFLAQLLQLLKVLRGGDASGLSPPAVLLQLYSSSCAVIYIVAGGFPFPAWADRFLVLVQTAAIVYLILHHRGESLKGLLFLLAYSGSMFLLGSCATPAVGRAVESSSLPALVASKVLQAGANFSNGHTGRLSAPSVLLSCLASLGLAFVSLQDGGGSLVLLFHVASAFSSCVLLAQVLCYPSRAAAKQKSQ